ncbi:tannase/feruloyl esterase family alpha/beta hydrolase [Piscinibacter sp.]|uniref:tannase/feruloyl esterase family alpha/beta hydrolase n=1 Tax=Piscinibacter sp. TaxID=1903157 RepID=UPI002ED111A7
MLIAASSLFTACGSGDAPAAAPTPAALACDDTLKAAFKPDPNTTVTFVKLLRAGDPVALALTPASPAPPVTPRSLCLVKMRVGPGQAGPADAPSTSAGIGIEVWLPDPADWNRRIHALGNGAWAGGTDIASSDVIGALFSAAIAATEGSISMQTDTGHTVENGSFAMNPDGTINTALWTDFGSRAVHEMVAKTKALAAAYYGSPPSYAYWDGCSTGGRQGHMQAQAYPADFDGILGGAPALDWTRTTAGQLYPQIVVQRDLPSTGLGAAQRTLVSAAAVSACDANLNGRHEGYVSDPSSCRYDPTKDASVLCVSSGGTNATSACLSSAQARAVNKIWYGATSDGSVPDPAVDSGGAAVLSGPHWAFGPTRGTELGLLAGGPTDAPYFGPFPVASDQVALSLQSPALATPSFRNATGTGQDGWKALSYATLALAQAQGAALQSQFGRIDTDSADLSAFRARGGKLLMYHGLADQLIPPQGSIRYYTRVAQALGGFASIQDFYRFLLVPGMGHCTGVGSVGGLPGISAQADPPMPAAGQLFAALTDWVEKGVAPTSVVVVSGLGTARRPLCAYPSKLAYVSGDTNLAQSYRCQ